MTSRQRSRFIFTYRLEPKDSFAGCEYQITTDAAKKLTISGDVAWIEFDAPSDLVKVTNEAEEILKDFLAILSFQVQHPLSCDLLSYLEDKPRDTVCAKNYRVGRKSDPPDVPKITSEDIEWSTFNSLLGSKCLNYRYAMSDYAAALSSGYEAIVFCARAVEWIEQWFPKDSKGTRRERMRKALCLPGNYTNKFFELANDTVIARHAGNLEKKRRPKPNEIEFSLFFTREAILKRFGEYIRYELSSKESMTPAYPSDKRPPKELWQIDNSTLEEELQQRLDSNYGGQWYIASQKHEF